MKKYIILIIFFAGLFMNFYSVYNNEINNHQKQLVVEAAESNNYDFFLKLNTYYEETYEFNNNYVLINKIYTDYNDTLSYNVIIRHLDDLELLSDEDLEITFTGDEGTLTTIQYTSYYNAYKIFNLQIAKDDIVENCGTLNNISLKNQEGEVKFSYDLNINLDNLTKEYLEKQEKGYTELETKELLKLDSYSNIFKQLAIFLGLYTIAVLLFFAGKWIYINKL
ncbi:MAG: hypothetical protein R3Y05_00745 [bacterium]